MHSEVRWAWGGGEPPATQQAKGIKLTADSLGWTTLLFPWDQAGVNGTVAGGCVLWPTLCPLTRLLQGRANPPALSRHHHTVHWWLFPWAQPPTHLSRSLQDLDNPPSLPKPGSYPRCLWVVVYLSPPMHPAAVKMIAGQNQPLLLPAP